MGNSSSKAFNTARLDGKTAIVTGANTGIGKVTTKELYKLGARVIMACRDIKRAEDAVNDIKSELSSDENVGELVIKRLNLSSLSSVKECADDINSTEPKINILINNAGIMACPKSKTEDGFETQFGVNHLGHFLFTNLLLKKIIDSAPSRIVNVSSRAHERIKDMRWDDLNWEKGNYSALGAYSQSKLANVLFTVELAKKLKDKNVTAYSLHPGVIFTELGRHIDDTYFRGARAISKILFSPITITPEKGALTTLYCALKEDDDGNGGYFSDCALKNPLNDEKSLNDATKLWELSTKMVEKYMPL